MRMVVVLLACALAACSSQDGKGTAQASSQASPPASHPLATHVSRAPAQSTREIRRNRDLLQARTTGRVSPDLVDSYYAHPPVTKAQRRNAQIAILRDAATHHAASTPPR